jgi:hypothetical protein
LPAEVQPTAILSPEPNSHPFLLVSSRSHERSRASDQQQRRGAHDDSVRARARPRVAARHFADSHTATPFNATAAARPGDAATSTVAAGADPDKWHSLPSVSANSPGAAGIARPAGRRAAKHAASGDAAAVGGARGSRRGSGACGKPRVACRWCGCTPCIRFVWTAASSGSRATCGALLGRRSWRASERFGRPT